MEKETRNAIQSATQKARRALEDDFREQLEGAYDIHVDGTIAPTAGPHLSAKEQRQRDRIVAAIEHKRAAGMKADQAVLDYLRDAAFTTLNRFVALKMLEAREIVQECISKGDASSGFAEFSGLAPGVKFPDGSGYRLYLECIFDELSTEVKVLFDRRDLSAVLWPKRGTFELLLGILNAPELAGVWGEDETIGWVYQFFNGQDERRKMREESQAPRNSRELAVRNQFFTPRYVVQFLSDNTLGRIWYEMRDGDTRLKDLCEYMVRRPDETWEPRAKKDPRDMRVLDPACGSGHFLLYCFDLLLVMYEEAWADAASPASELTGKTLREDYLEIAELRAALPGLILRHNLHGVDIDARCAQIGQLALWMRAQRAFKQFGIGRAERPIIKRANIVIAEPMPGEKDLLKEFLAELKEDKLEKLIRRALDVPDDKRVRATKAMADSLAELIETVWDGMKLAGEMGTLLKIERDLARAIDKGRAEWEDTLPLFRVADYGLGGITNEKLVRVVPGAQEDFWTKAETLVFQALADYSAAASGSGNLRKRLFAEDAAQGFALVDLMTQRFVTVLMNPPFGQSVEGVFDKLAKDYSGAHHDIYAAFVSRAAELAPCGAVGCISSRSFLVTTRLEDFRRKNVLPSLTLLADLGPSVMDNASVEAAAYVLMIPSPGTDVFTALSRDDLQKHATRVSAGRGLERAVFQALPAAKILHSLPSEFLELLRGATPFEGAAGTAREGMKSFDNFRFVRLWWEVPPGSVGAGSEFDWTWFAKGGGHAEWFMPSDLVINWSSEGRELQYINLQLNGSTAQVRQASSYWFRRGATYSRRSIQFAVRVLPDEHVFSTEGPAVLVESSAPSNVSNEYLLGWLNSRLCRLLVEIQANKQKYLTGIIKRLPWRSPPSDLATTVGNSVAHALQAHLNMHALSETCPQFVGLPQGSDLASRCTTAQHVIEMAINRTRECENVCNRNIDHLYGVDSSLVEDALSGANGVDEEIVDGVEEEDDNTKSFMEPFDLDRSLSWLVGAVFARFDPRLATTERALPPEPKPFDPPPLRSPAMYPEGEEPAELPDILVNDEGHPDDLAARVLALAERVRLDAPENLSDCLASGFFPLHIRMYSKSRRKAPIYWQLATPSASYSVWLYIHAFTKDTLFRVQNDYVAGKLAHEERQLETLRAEAGPDPVTVQRKAVEVQEGFVEELRTFLDEVKRVAPLWSPNLDDGVIINFAPLWRLVPHHKPWQKELKATWDALCTGKYDWAHLAMHLWPERVVPKCAEDRSLAIAHDLEDVFWNQDDGEKWKPREEPTKPIDALVKERTSSAVKAALKSLMEAPEQSNRIRRGRGRR